MEKRPLGFIGAIFFLTMVVLSRFGFEKSLYIMPVFLVAVFFVFLRRKKIRFFAIITSAVLCASMIFFISERNFTTKEEYFSGKEVAVEGVLYKRPHFNGENYLLYIETDKVNDNNVSMRIRVKSLSVPENATLYNKVKLKANLYKVDGLDDGVLTSFKSEKIVLVGSCVGNSLKVYENQSKPLMYYLLSYKYKLVDAVYNLLPNDIGGFIAGIAFGEKDLLSDEMLHKFRVTGTSHILVVSGLHVAIWSGFLYKLLKRFFSRKYTSLISILFLLLFMAFTGFTPSVVRAGVMMILNYTAIIFSEKPDSLNTLGISALVLTVADPFSVYNVGTVFSFASVFGILLMNEYVHNKVKNFISLLKPKIVRKVLYYVASAVLVSLSAQIFAFPVAVLYNFDFSYLSLVANFFISIFTTLSMVSGGTGAILLTILPDFIFTKIILGTSILSSRLILHIIDKLSCFEDFYRNVTTIENYILLMLVGLVIFLLVFINSSQKRKMALFAIFLVPIMLISNLIPAVYKNNFVEMSVIDVGNGMCVAFTNNEEAVLLGCGGDYSAIRNITDYLETRNVTQIKALYLPVDNSARIVNRARYLKDEINIESVVTSSEYKFSFISSDSTSADYVKADYFLGKLKIDYYTEKNCSYALAVIGDTRVLINFYGSLKEESLPHGCINPDIYVTMYPNTYKTDFSSTDEYIVSSSYCTSVPASAKNIHFTENDSTYIKAIRF